MTNQPLARTRAATAAEICACFSLKEDARQLLRPAMSPREFVDALVAGKQYLSGIDFIAHTVPPREGIWWGCLCMQHACGDQLSPAERAAAIAAVRWVITSTEANRAAAQGPAQSAGPASPAGALAMAAWQTGGSIAPPNMKPIAPDPFAPAKLVATAVKLATLKSDPARILDTQKQFLELGIEVARGWLS